MGFVNFLRKLHVLNGTCLFTMFWLLISNSVGTTIIREFAALSWEFAWTWLEQYGIFASDDNKSIHVIIYKQSKHVCSDVVEELYLNELQD